MKKCFIALNQLHTPMKKKSFFLCCLSIICLPLVYGQTNKIAGAWRLQDGDIQHTLVMVDGYLAYSTFDIKNKKFINTWGGPYTEETQQLQVNIQFNAQDPQDVQKKHIFNIKAQEELTTDISGESTNWKRIDDNDGPLVGVWRITARKIDGQLNDMPLRDRRTLKILSGTRFQWVAINIKTGEFSGTGGGFYTFTNNEYTENIEFFSRDNTRVGASLTFDGKIENNQWHHSGLSSKGEPIDEIWGRLTEE